jgi:hypothetical protein
MNKEEDQLKVERFMSGVKQQWAAVFLFFGTGVFVGTLLVPGLDPTPFMQFLLAIGSLFILGASGDSWVKAYSVKSIRETEVKEETKRIEVNSKKEGEPDQQIIMQYQQQYSNDQSYAPLGWIEEQAQ